MISVTSRGKMLLPPGTVWNLFCPWEGRCWSRGAQSGVKPFQLFSGDLLPSQPSSLTRPELRLRVLLMSSLSLLVHSFFFFLKLLHTPYPALSTSQVYLAPEHASWWPTGLNTLFSYKLHIVASLVAQTVKNPPAIQDIQVQYLSWEDFPKRGMALPRQSPSSGILPIPVFLPGQSHGQRGLKGYSPWGRKESDTTEWLTYTMIYWVYFYWTTMRHRNFRIRIFLSTYSAPGIGQTSHFHILWPLILTITPQVFPSGSVVKNTLAMQETWGRHRFDPCIRKMPWRMKWQPTTVFLPEKSHGQRSLAVYNPCSCEE